MGKIIHSHYSIKRRARPGETPGTCRIALLADLHNKIYRSDIPSLVKAVETEDCDAVMAAGDLVVMKHGRFATDKALELVRGLTGKLPVYVANGNHETRMDRLYHDEFLNYENALADAGAVRLHNRSCCAELNGVRLYITGLELSREYFKRRFHKDLSAGEIRELVGVRKKDRFNILLAHHPKYFHAYARWGADLVLAGHLHGGIIRLPYLGGVISPDPHLFPRFDHGLYRIGASSMIVSAGLGTHTINLRINNPAELVIIDITVE